jgi:histidyl-tRNA synthetase
LVSQLGGPETPAVGWASGMERLIILLQELQPLPPAMPDLYMVSRGDRAEGQALKLSQDLRRAGLAVELDLSSSAFGKQFKRADRSGAVACLILGDTEAEQRMVQIKWLKTGEQRAIAQSDLIQSADDFRQQIIAARLAP